MVQTAQLDGINSKMRQMAELELQKEYREQQEVAVAKCEDLLREAVFFYSEQLRDVAEIASQNPAAAYTVESDRALHIDLRGWAEAANFENVTSRSLTSPDFIELRFKRGQNEDCHDAADAERWLGYIARGMGFRIPPGDCVIEMTGDQFAAWFWWEPRPTGD